MHRIAVIGLGYVGASLAIMLSQKNIVVGYDTDQDKIDMLTKPHDGMLESLQSTFKAYVNNEYEIVYVVSVRRCADESIDDRLGIAFRIVHNMPMEWYDYIAQRNETNYLRTTENGNKCAYLLVPYGLDYYPKNKI